MVHLGRDEQWTAREELVGMKLAELELDCTGGVAGPRWAGRVRAHSAVAAARAGKSLDIRPRPAAGCTSQGPAGRPAGWRGPPAGWRFSGPAGWRCGAARLDDAVQDALQAVVLVQLLVLGPLKGVARVQHGVQHHAWGWGQRGDVAVGMSV